MAKEDGQIEVVNNKTEGRFEARVDDHDAFLEYELSGGNIIFTHTEVPPPLENRGIGKALVQTALDHARRERLGVVPLCSFVAVYIRRHPEYQSLVVSK